MSPTLSSANAQLYKGPRLLLSFSLPHHFPSASKPMSAFRLITHTLSLDHGFSIHLYRTLAASSLSSQSPPANKLTGFTLALMAVAAAEAGCRTIALNGAPFVIATFSDTACYNENFRINYKNDGACFDIRSSKSFIF
ncbi:hypothetical protein BX616_010428, partial [Lobosporangium transversale]